MLLWGRDLSESHFFANDVVAADRLELFEDVRAGPFALSALLVGREQRLQSALHVPRQVGGQHADEDLSPDAIVCLVVDGTHLPSHGFEITKRGLDMAQVLVGGDDFVGVHRFWRGIRHDDIAVVEQELGGDPFLPEAPLQLACHHLPLDELARLVLAQNAPAVRTDICGSTSAAGCGDGVEFLSREFQEPLPCCRLALLACGF